MHRKYKGHSDARKEALRYIKKLALLLVFSLAFSLALGSPVLSLAHSRSRYIHTYVTTRLAFLLALGSPVFLLTFGFPFSRSLILDLDTYMPTSLPDLITSASCVRSCNRTTQDGSTMTIMTFLKKKISRFELCVAISPLIGHVEKKWKYFYNIIRTQAIDCVYSEFHRFSRWDSVITGIRNSPVRVKIHGPVSPVLPDQNYDFSPTFK